MNPELQTLVDRIEMLERQSRAQRGVITLALVTAVVAAAMALLASRPHGQAPPTGGRFAAIETNRLILRDLDDRVAGGLEIDRNGTARLVLGGRDGRGAAVIEAQANGVSHVTLRGPEGDVLASLVGSSQPALTIGGRGDGPGATIAASEEEGGSILLRDPQGRLRFRAP